MDPPQRLKVLRPVVPVVRLALALAWRPVVRLALASLAPAVAPSVRLVLALALALVASARYRPTVSWPGGQEPPSASITRAPASRRRTPEPDAFPGSAGASQARHRRFAASAGARLATVQTVDVRL